MTVNRRYRKTIPREVRLNRCIEMPLQFFRTIALDYRVNFFFPIENLERFVEQFKHCGNRADR